MAQPSASIPRSMEAESQPTDINADALMNLSLLDRPRWGWPAVGGVADILTPHERARRSLTREAYIKTMKRREREGKSRKQASATLAPSVMAAATARQSELRPPVEDSRKPDPNLLPKKVMQGEKSQPKLLNSQSAEDGSSMTQNPLQTNDIAGAVSDDRAAAADAASHGVSKKHPEDEIVEMFLDQSLTESVGRPIKPTMVPVLARTGAVSDTNAPEPMSFSWGSSNHGSDYKASYKSNPMSTESSSIRNDMKQDTGIQSGNAIPVESHGSSSDGETNRASKAAAQEAGDGENNHKHDDVRVQAVSEDGILDMYTYHRGREGAELRDTKTGHLLCDAEKTDTNWGWEPPKMSMMMTISFPLSESSSSGNGDSDSGDGKPAAVVSLYKETIAWDLSDPATHTPLTFATALAEEFGLSFGQTFELASSMQRQIDEFVSTQVYYAPPLTVKNSLGNYRPATVASSHVLGGPVQLYGSVNGSIPGGVQLPTQPARFFESADGSITVEKTKDSLNVLKKPRPIGGAFSDVEPEYRDEVKRRAKMESIEDIKQQCPDGYNGVMTIHKDYSCHVCRNRKPRCGCFGCNIASHALCDTHLLRIAGITLPNTGNTCEFELCPICCLQCDCAKCSRKLNTIAGALKEKALEQGSTAEGVYFSGLLQLCQMSESAIEKSISLRPSSAKPTVRTHIPVIRTRSPERKKRNPVKVTKVPVSEFPRETCSGRDLDPAKPEDYQTVFLEERTFVDVDESNSMENQQEVSALEPVVAEDGNVDYCVVCQKTGNLYCCDFCPRAFHRECLAEDIAETGGYWECHICSHEKRASSEEDCVNGNPSFDVICGNFKDFDHSDRLIASARILSMIHEMVTKLVRYDFGHIFQAPVDPKQVPGYSTVIENPMDLGTIKSKLEEGIYSTKYNENNSWDDVVAAPLKDIELVWHNCFTFNSEGSSVYRMARVQRRKCQNIQQCSFEHLINQAVKDQVSRYAEGLKKERSRMPNAESASGHPHKQRRSVGRNKIIVPLSVGRTARCVAVFDPESHKIVKVYSSIKSACQAATLLVDLGHPVEIKNFGDGTLRMMLQKSRSDPSQLLFGYRWVYLDDLRARRVNFSKPKAHEERVNQPLPDKPSSPELVQMKDGENTFTFVSVEEALSFSDLPKEMSLAEMRQRLVDLPVGEWRTIVGFSWKRLPAADIPCDKESGGTLETKESDANFSSSLKNGFRHPFPSHVTFVKQDLVGRSILLGFDSIAGAYQDWLVTRESSPTFQGLDVPDIRHFELYYLQGPRNIDGIIWRPVAKGLRTGAEEGGVSEDNQTNKSALSQVTKQETFINGPVNPASQPLEVEVVGGRPQLIPVAATSITDVHDNERMAGAQSMSTENPVCFDVESAHLRNGLVSESYESQTVTDISNPIIFIDSSGRSSTSMALGVERNGARGHGISSNTSMPRGIKRDRDNDSAIAHDKGWVKKKVIYNV